MAQLKVREEVPENVQQLMDDNGAHFAAVDDNGDVTLYNRLQEPITPAGNQTFGNVNPQQQQRRT